MYNILLLGSSSQSRQMLLRRAKIPFTAIGHTLDESSCGVSDSLPQLTHLIAREKMNHVIMPDVSEGQVQFVLTADTLSQNPDGRIVGKPTDQADAISMIKAAQKGQMISGTAFCLDKKIFQKGSWHIQERIEKYVEAGYIFNIPDRFLDDYFRNSTLYLSASGAIAIEDYGIQYFKEIHGSFTAVVGLPMYELYQALEDIGFLQQAHNLI